MLNKELEHFRNLISLAMADGILAEDERVYLSKIAFQKGIPLDRMNIMLERAEEYTYLIPQNKEEKSKQLNQMIEFAFVDGEFAKAERDLIMTVGEKLGYAKSEIELMIEKYTVS